MIVLSLVAGIAAVFVAGQWLNGRAVQTVQVAVASRDIDLGSPLNVTMVEMVGWPKDTIPSGAFNTSAALDGRVLKTNLVRGEPIVEAKLAPQGAKGGLSAVIKEGKRAVTVRVNEVVGVAGFALPGNYVDVMVNLTDHKSEQVSKIVLERILVLAVAQEANQDQTKPKVVNAVTLEVTPEEAEKIDLVRNVGTLSLVLRNQMDSKPILTGGASKQDILRVSQAAAVASADVPAPRKAVARSHTVSRKPVERGSGSKVVVIRGLQKSEVEFQ
ncbi:MAG TPA: Flp pilus assembly protein CpaB [Rhodocyclaceae bacterium]|nr:Flp pilus assembly protein CpaB [Rhodocyclaceae bacterium]